MGNRIEYGHFGRSAQPQVGDSDSSRRKCRCLNKLDGLFFALLLLKLWGVVGWSWWIISAPIWVPVTFATVVFIGKVGYEMAKQNRGEP